MKKLLWVASAMIVVAGGAIYGLRDWGKGDLPSSPQSPSVHAASGCAVEAAQTSNGSSCGSMNAPGRAPQAALPVQALTPTSDDRRRLGILNEILVSRNDGDPRLDAELRVLAPGLRQLLRGRYRELAAEQRNELGTIVFLLGRNLEEAGDFEFFSSVLGESPCRSLSDCQSADPQDVSHDAGHEMGTDVTLSYPQIVALKSLERALESGATAERRAQSIRLLRQAMSSPVPAVSRMASELYNRYGGSSS